MKKNSLFREAALNQLSSPEQLDQLIQVASYKTWLVITGISVLMLAVVLWLVFGNISTYAEGQGILLPGGGNIENASIPEGPGRVDSILVKIGQSVSKGQKLAVLSRPDLIKQLTVAQQYQNSLNQKYQQLVKQSQADTATYYQSIEVQRQATTNNFINNQAKLKNNLQLFRIKLAAFQKGVETRQSLAQTLQDYFTNKSEVVSYPDQLAKLNMSEADFKDQWRERLFQMQLKIADANNNLKNLQARNQLALGLVSPVTGTIINIQGAVGDILQTGAPLFIIGSQGKGLDALIFLPPFQGKQVKPGMKALVAPASVIKAQFGSILGKVISVDTYPTTAQAISSNLQNPELAKAFTNKQVPIVARVSLQQDTSTFSGLKWSSSKGPHQKITPGNLASAQITVRQQAPITLVLPSLKKLLGVD